MNETIWEPVILSVALSPNPVDVGGAVLLKVTAIDVFGQEQTEARFAGEFYSGEV